MAEHRINHLEVELHTTSVPVARALFERLGQIHGNRVVPVLDRVCSELAAGDELVRLDRLELELGTLPADGFEDEFVERLAQALRAALTQALRRRSDGDRRAAAALEVVEIFALTGGLPWWAPTDDGVVARHFAYAAVAAPGELLAVLRRIAGDAGAIDRLARLCDRDALVALVGRVQGGDPRQVRARDATERGALLRSLAAHPGPGRELAGAAERPPEGDPAREPASPTDAPPARPPGVAATVRDPNAAIAREDRVGAAIARGDRVGAAAVDRFAPADAATRDDSRELEAQPSPGTAQLRQSAGAAAAAAGSRSPPAERDDDAPFDAAPGEAASRGAREPSPIDREPVPPRELVPPRDPVPPREPVEVAAPAARERIDGRVAASAEPAAPVAPTSAGMFAHRPAAMHQSAAPPAQAAPAPAAPPAQAAPAPAAAHAARRRALGQLDELYVEDAGLVILWPFLERLFHRTGILGVDRRFVDEAAQVQAVALVELLATGDPEPLEFQLPLAKLLCGRPPESDFVLDRPLPPEQIAETDHLLAAVIDHAPVGELSIAGLRTAFLQRSAALTTRDGAWLLQVERHPHDAILDRFPWSWSWIKLPWMPDPLRVEW